ncbi:MAG: DUF1648 domain-containing protein [Gordonia sp. (in: high G+C Gram-positive bacteria)]|uniref:DUF1648 domain-containing protein n=1 Tax=Gordonia sp. (in: high G+C Gram-positive bacteria) TaxID=84139 RepID=UPI0039E3E488
MSRASWSLVPAIAVYAITWCWVAVSAPDRVPMHWGAGGTVDRWGSRTEFLAFSFGTAAAVTALLVGLAVFADRLPTSVINTPHRDYWLSPEHRAAFNRINRQMLFDIAALTILLFAAINVFVVTDAGGGAVIGLVVAFLIAMAVVIAIPVRRLYTEPRSAGSR